MSGLFHPAGFANFAYHAGSWFQNAEVQGSDACPVWGWPSRMMGGSMGWFGGIFMLVFWLAILLAVIAAVRWLSGAGREPRPRLHDASSISSAETETPLDILRKRYACGELSKEQFESMKRDLE